MTANTPTSKCEHESDDVVYTSNPSQSRCKKCGVFYGFRPEKITKRLDFGNFNEIDTLPTPTTDSKNSSEDWEKELRELVPVMLGGSDFKEYAPLIMLIRRIEQQAEARGRKELGTEVKIAGEIYKAQGYEDFGERLIQLVNGLKYD